MRERFLFGGLDCFHFNAAAYDVLVNNLVQEYLNVRFQSGLALELAGEVPVYDGSPKAAEILSDPPVDALIVSYDGSLAPPVDAGVYDLVVTAPGWRKSLATSFVVARASQTVDLSSPEAVPITEPDIELQSSASSGLLVELEVISGPASLDGQTLVLDGAPGTVVIVARQPGDGNWLPAEPVQRQIEVFELTDALFEDRFEPSSVRR